MSKRTKNPYYTLAKPGIVYGNLFAGAAGYFLGRDGIGGELALLIGGLGLVLASAGYANNIMDLEIDSKMTRTQKRPLVSGVVPVSHAYIGASVFLIAGVGLLLYGGGILAAVLALIGWLGYLFLYGCAKRRTHHSTLIGALPGAVPPLVGYAFAAQTIDVTAGILFLMMFFWQMPHFYGISLFRQKEYAAAHVPILPIVKGVKRTLLEMRVYVLLYLAACVLLVGAVSVNIGCALILLGSALWWSLSVLSRTTTGEEISWSRTVFKKSLLVLLLWPVAFAVNILT